MSLVLILGCAGGASSGPSSPVAPDGTGGRASTPGGTGGTPGSGGTGGQGGGRGPSGAGGSGAGAGGTRGEGGNSSTNDGGVGTQDTRGGSGDAGSAPADVRPPLGDAGPSSDAGTPPAAGLDQRCTVPTTFVNKVMGAAGAAIFTASFPDPVAAMQAHARAICRILYRRPEEVRNVSAQRLTLDVSEDIAYTAGNAITFSTDYINDFANGKSKAAIDAELNGVLVHEGAHVWQYTNGGGALVEAMADYVRYKAGFYTLARRSRGGNWNAPYTIGGFFIAWVEEKYDPDYGYRLNMGMKERGFDYPAFVQKVTGKSIDVVWAEYQAAIR